MTQVGSVVERMPMAYLDRGDANRHGVLFVCAFPSVVRAHIAGIYVSFEREVGHGWPGRRGHERAAFAPVHGPDLLYLVPVILDLWETHETARVHDARWQRGHSMAARGA